MQACLQALRACDDGATLYNGYLSVPSTSSPGLYTILLNANYSSLTTQDDFGVTTINGSFYGQVEVTSGPITPAITISPSTLYEGQTATLMADIHYASGQEVRFGEYTAVVYPQELQGEYTTIMHSEYANSQLISLSFDPTLNRWVGNFTLPSPYDAGVISPVNGNSLYYSGPYDAYVTGLSFDGVPTTTATSSEQSFFIQPFVYVSGQGTQPSAQVSGIAFSGDMISGPASLSGDVFLGTNTITGGTVTIASSQIEGTLDVSNAQLTLVGVSGGTIIASGSTISLKDTAVGSIQLSDSKLYLNSSSFLQITPSLPAIQVTQPTVQSAGSGNVSLAAQVTGQQVSSVTFWVDGSLIKTFQGSPGQATYNYTLNAASLPDGVHVLTVTETQSDGISASSSIYFSTNHHLATAEQTIGQQMSQLATQNSDIQSQNDSLQSQSSTIQSQAGSLASANSKINDQSTSIRNLTYGLYTLAIVAIVALAIGLVAMMSKRNVKPSAETSPPATVGPPAAQ
jgi:hypothetical protein